MKGGHLFTLSLDAFAYYVSVHKQSLVLTHIRIMSVFVVLVDASEDALEVLSDLVLVFVF